MPCYDMYFILVNIGLSRSNELCMTCKCYLAGKINPQGRLAYDGWQLCQF